MTRRTLLAVLLASGALAGCGGNGSPAAPAPASSPPASQVPGLSGLQRAVDAARGAVATSQQDAQRASATGPGQ